MKKAAHRRRKHAQVVFWFKRGHSGACKSFCLHGDRLLKAKWKKERFSTGQVYIASCNKSRGDMVKQANTAAGLVGQRSIKTLINCDCMVLKGFKALTNPDWTIKDGIRINMTECTVLGQLLDNDISVDLTWLHGLRMANNNKSSFGKEHKFDYFYGAAGYKCL